MRVSVLSIFINIALSLLKLLAGVIAKSGAMTSDAVHSVSDVLSTFVVIAGVRLAGKKPDNEHPYGHERMECVAAIILDVILAATGTGIGLNALESIISRDAGGAVVPGLLALIAAVVSIVTTEGMYRYTVFFARKLDSASLMASAWDHRSDAFSSIGALVGIAGARMGYPILEHIASIVICLFILKAALDIFREALDKMVDHSAGDELEQAIKKCAEEQPNVLGVDLIRTREFGSRVYVDIEISADGSLTLTESHEIAQRVHDAIEHNFEKVKHIMVHVNPVDEDGNAPSHACTVDPDCDRPDHHHD